MSEQKTPKWLHETTVKKQVEDKIVTKDEKDPTIEVTKTVKKAKPVKVATLKPNRKLGEAAEIFYAATTNEYLRKGLMPLSLVAKRYANDGGALSEPEKEAIEILKKEATKYEGEYFALDIKDTSESVNQKRKELLTKINDVNTKLNSIQNAYSDIYDNTAEMKARNKTIEWWVLHLSHYDLDDKGYKPVFPGDTYEAKIDSYDTIEEKDDRFINEIISFCSYLTSFWLTARGTLSKEELQTLEFSAMEKLYWDTVSNYKVEETEEKSVKLNETPVEEKPIVPIALPEIAKI